MARYFEFLYQFYGFYLTHSRTYVYSWFSMHVYSHSYQNAKRQIYNTGKQLRFCAFYQLSIYVIVQTGTAAEIYEH
jgi:hypothetical protein